MILRFTSFALGGLCLSAVPYACALSASDTPSDTPVSQLIASANANLAQGNAHEALAYFDLAVQRDPSNYLTVFKRGATQLSLGRHAQASKDFDQVLVLKPGFEGALVQRANIKSRNGDWNAAKEDYKAAGKAGDGDEVKRLMEAEGAALLASAAEQSGDWETCTAQADTAILVANMALRLRQTRARCRLEKGDIQWALSDLGHMLQINPALTEPYLRIAAMTFYSFGKTDEGVTAISRCLHNDPDNKECARLRKSIKAIDRAVKQTRKLLDKRQFASAAKLLVPQGDSAGLLKDIHDDTQAHRAAGYIHPRAADGLYAQLVEQTCEAYVEMNNAGKSRTYCDEALAHNPDSLPALLSRAQRQLDADEFDAALQTLAHAADTPAGAAGAAATRVAELQRRARTLLHRSRQKDYYKVLGVGRDADAREIKRAFRRLTVQHHPDKVAQHGTNEADAQRRMAAINEAYEVLSDPELRARFDAGDDPNDPQAQMGRGGGGSPFTGSAPPFGFRAGGGGGHPFFEQARGGGSQFQFQFGGGGFPF